MAAQRTIFVILAGGQGERLWPLSSSEHPKQLLPFIDDRSLLEQTVDRIKSLRNNYTELVVVTNSLYENRIRELLLHESVTIISESIGRNTAPAIMATCLLMQKKDPQAILVFLPSDHFIPDANNFNMLLSHACRYAGEHDKLILLGVKPTYPACGYGYISFNQHKKDQDFFYDICAFHEKPQRSKAEEYLADSSVVWNIGIVVGTVDAFLRQSDMHAPLIMSAVQAYIHEDIPYDQVPAVSFDYAVLEKSKDVVVMPCDITWFDVGNLESFIALKQMHKKDIGNKILSFEGTGNLAQTLQKDVIFYGVSDVCLVETENILLVISRRDIEQVKQIKNHMQRSEDHDGL